MGVVTGATAAGVLSTTAEVAVGEGAAFSAGTVGTKDGAALVGETSADTGPAFDAIPSVAALGVVVATATSGVLFAGAGCVVTGLAKAAAGELTAAAGGTFVVATLPAAIGTTGAG